MELVNKSIINNMVNFLIGVGVLVINIWLKWILIIK